MQLNSKNSSQDLKTFSQYITEIKQGDQQVHGDFHEHMVSYMLRGGKHENDPDFREYVEARKKIPNEGEDSFLDHMKRAKAVSDYIKQNFGSQSPITAVSRIGNSTSKLQKATGSVLDDTKNNHSDIVLHHEDGSKTGINLKMHTSQDRPEPLTKISATKSLKGFFGNKTPASRHIDLARKELLDKYPELAKLRTNKEIANAILSNPNMKRDSDELSDKHLRNARDEMHGAINSIDQKSIRHHLKASLRSGNTIPVETVLSHRKHVLEPFTVRTSLGKASIEKAIRSRGIIKAIRTGNSTISYLIDGKPLVSHRLKRDGATVFNPHSIEPVLFKSSRGMSDNR